jgi:protein phosphatase
MRTMKVECYALSDLGRVRPRNEDQYLLGSLQKCIMIQLTSLSREDHSRLVGDPQGSLIVVADGMGGMGAGSVASSLAVDTVVSYVLNVMPWFFRLDEALESDLGDELKAGLARCAEVVGRAADAGEGTPYMGTTLTMAYVLWPRAYVVHAGDSRCYLFRGGHAHQVTRDQTIAQRLADARVLTPDQARESSWRNVVWSAVGGGTDGLHTEVYKLDLEPRDVLLLCTDGLTKHVADDEIASVLGNGSSAEETCRRLVGMANEAGGTDNITVAVAAFS